MIIVNLNNKRTIAKDAKVAYSFLDKALGLINNNNPRSMVFYTRWGIHTFFLKQPIDLLLLNDDHLVVSIKQSFKVNSLFVYNPRYKTVIELPNNKIRDVGVKMGDKIFIG